MFSAGMASVLPPKRMLEWMRNGVDKRSHCGNTISASVVPVAAGHIRSQEREAVCLLHITCMHLASLLPLYFRRLYTTLTPLINLLSDNRPHPIREKQGNDKKNISNPISDWERRRAECINYCSRVIEGLWGEFPLPILAGLLSAAVSSVIGTTNHWAH